MNLLSSNSKSNILSACLLSILLLCGIDPINSTAQSPDKDEPIEVLVMGTFHFKHTPEFNPIDAPEQQQEIKALNNALAEFQPNRIAVEFTRDKQAYVDSLYQAYLNGKHELTVNERQQVGFKLGKRLNHDRIFAIDYVKPWGMDTVMNWASKHQPEFIDYFNSWQEQNKRMDSLLHQTKSIPEIVRTFNSDSFLTQIQHARMTTLEVGAGENYIGVKPLASVYERNMRIFANLIDISEPGDRVLIVYGAGHTYFFHRFIEQHPDMELIPISTYL